MFFLIFTELYAYTAQWSLYCPDALTTEGAGMEVLLFGVTRDIVGAKSLPIEKICETLPGTVRELKQCLGEQYPDLRKLTALAVAVNKSYAEEEDGLKEGDEIALIPPVSGG